MAKKRARPATPKAKTKPKARPKARPRPKAELDAQPEFRVLAEVAQARELFWQNVMREMLTSLAMVSSANAPDGVAVVEEGTAEEPQDGHAEDEAETESEGEGESEGEDEPAGNGSMLDGRLAVITAQGQRVPIAAVIPLLACSVGSSHHERLLSTDLQCTVFQIATPAGEVYTLPLHEIRGFHAMSEALMQQLEQAAVGHGTEEKPGLPFGFAAFTSVARASERAEENRRP